MNFQKSDISAESSDCRVYDLSSFYEHFLFVLSDTFLYEIVKLKLEITMTKKAKNFTSVLLRRRQLSTATSCAAQGNFWREEKLL